MTISRPTSPRIAPITEPSAELNEVLAKTLIGASGKPINIFGTLGHHPKLLKRFNVLGGFFLNNGLLPAREREIVILRVGYLCQAVYEFGQHTVIGLRVGLTDAEITALASPNKPNKPNRPYGPIKGSWTPKDAALIALADDLCADDCVSDETWALLRADWNEAELIELVMVAGMYRMVSGFLNTMGVQLDEGVPEWPGA